MTVCEAAPLKTLYNFYWVTSQSQLHFRASAYAYADPSKGCTSWISQTVGGTHLGHDGGGFVSDSTAGDGTGYFAGSGGQMVGDPDVQGATLVIPPTGLVLYLWGTYTGNTGTMYSLGDSTIIPQEYCGFGCIHTPHPGLLSYEKVNVGSSSTGPGGTLCLGGVRIFAA